MERVSAQQLAEWAAEARERWSVPGIAVGLFYDGETFVVADGVGELGGDEPVSPETAFRIASITKPFTATLALALAEEGLLALDEPPPGSQVEATIRQLLSHQGGLACEWPSALEQLNPGGDGLQRVAEGEPPRLPVGPGEHFPTATSASGSSAPQPLGLVRQRSRRRFAPECSSRWIWPRPSSTRTTARADTSRPSRAPTSTSSSTTRTRGHERRRAVSGRRWVTSCTSRATTSAAPARSPENPFRRCSGRTSPLPAGATASAGSCASPPAGGSSSTQARRPASSRCSRWCRRSASASPRCRIRA